MFGKSSKIKKEMHDRAESSSSSPENIAKQEKLRSVLTKELETVVKAAIASPYSSRENISSEITQNICNSIEAIFIHGLRDPFFLKGTRYSKYPEPNFWPFVSKYSHRNVTNQISSLKQINTEIGKSRAWIRIVLNENSLSHYLDLLASEKGAINQFYGNNAFLRYLSDNEYSEQIRGILKPLATIPIYAATNSSFLNRWTPTPLILAGLSTGDPLKVGALTPRRNPRADSIGEEIAVSALDMLVPEEDHDIGSPNRLKKRRRNHSKTYTNKSEEDEVSSVYSHPSMVDAGEMSYQHALLSRKHPSSSSFRPSSSSHRIQLPQSPLFTSTPIENPVIDSAAPTISKPVNVVSIQTSESEYPESYAPLIVSRLKKRPPRHSKSRSSSESTSREGKSRANSDMPSTIFGTVPNEVSFSVEDNTLHVSETIDSGICENIGDQKVEVGNTTKSDTTLLEAIQQLTSTSQPDFFVTDKSNEKQQNEECEIVEDADIAEEVFDVELDKTDDVVEKIQEKDVSIIEHQGQSLIGTSLHDELLNALPSVENETFEQGIPIYVQSPKVMGNSLQAIGARKHIGSWDTMSERSRLSSSSDSCGPVMSFGQALRSAMDIGVDQDVHFDESVCTSATNTDHEESVADMSTSSRKTSSVTSEIEEKLCTIAREKGLDSQDFRCAMCRKTIGGSTFSKFETCAIDSKYYCADCMKSGGKSAIPARVLMDWDWRERAISDRGRAWIEANLEKALMNVKERNERLYKHVPALEETRRLREKLQYVSMYLFTCRESVAEDFRRRVWPKEYLHAEIHKYSFADLEDVKSGSLQKKLNHLIKHATSHVMACTLCRQKGFICELCNLNDVIYPFQTDETHRCLVCFSVLHKPCWKTSGECPKCLRRQQFETRRQQIDEPHSLLVLQP